MQAGPDNSLIAPLVERACATIRDHEAELTELDRAIGDGDHGVNMRRGFEAIAAQRAELQALDFWPAVQKAGTILVMRVGGASGPLYGSLLMAMGKAEGGLAERFAAGVAAVKSRGKSDIGAKTMLDVLVPVQQALAAGATPAALRAIAAEAAAATLPMRASKGRASFLGERSVGHVDPGARSAELLIAMACDLAENPMQAAPMEKSS
ncbi:MAG: dihydroxyacetone kinase subunit DhaL [Sneathiellaceae bacterium]